MIKMSQTTIFIVSEACPKNSKAKPKTSVFYLL